MYVFLAVAGAAMGSFVGALTWRIHAKKNFVSDRSECETCHHKLNGTDLIPIFSWLLRRGKCCYCGAKIGQLTLWLEIGMAALFVASYAFWPLGTIDNPTQIMLFVIWLIIVVMMAALALYDARWSLLPNKIMFPLIAAAAIFGIAVGFAVENLTFSQLFAKIILAMIPVAGVYGALYVFSRGKWVGFGDVKFGVAVGFLVDWQAALLVLILANIIGTIVIAPLLAAKKLRKNSKIPFGPMLIVAAFVAFLWGQTMIDWFAKTFF